jgi:peptidoglycan/xylan/chitin deacetylase (PgdA/CDA1 family)
MNVRSFLIASGLSDFFSINKLAFFSKQNFVLPFYHIVSNEDAPHIKHLYKVKTTQQFEADLDFLLKHYAPLSVKDLPDIIAGKYAGQRTMLLTFDDGLREVHDVIVPILYKKGVPAIFFLNSDFIDNRNLMFRYKVSLLIDKINSKEKITQLLSYRNDNLFIADFAQEIQFSFQDFLNNYEPYLSSEQVTSLIGKGFSIGAHSCSHPYYEDISLEEQAKETLDSLRFLQVNFGIEEKLFAFPFTDFGVGKDFFEEIYRDHKIDFSFGGAGMKQDFFPNHFQRIAMESPAANAQQLLKAEYLYYILKKPFGKNTIIRN